jgi:hypothetical protein
MGDVFAASGTKVFITTAALATIPANAAAWEALTWTEIGLVENIGNFGDSASSQNFSALGDARVRKAKGARDGGNMTVTCGYDGTDAGQTAVVAAEATNVKYGVKIELPNKIVIPTGTNELRFFRALVNSAQTQIGGNDDIVRLVTEFGIDSAIVKKAAT